MKLGSRKAIIGLSTCMALQMTSFVMILPLFPRRFAEIGAGVEEFGISSMAYALTATLAAPIMGALADRFGRRPLVLVSLAVYVLAFCGYLFASSAAVFIVLRGLAGAFTAGLIPAVTGLAADIAPKDRQAQWIGFMNAGSSIGWVAGPIAGGMVYDNLGYSTAVVVSIIMALVALLVAILLVPKTHLSSTSPITGSVRRTTGSRSRNIKSYLMDLRSTLPDSLSSFVVLLLIFFTVLFAWAFIEPRYYFYAYNDLGWSSSMLGAAMSTYGIAMVFGELAFGRSSDRFGRKPVILTGLVLFSAQFLGMAFLRNYIWISTTFVIAGFGNALYDPALSASILDISPAEHRSRILGIKSMVGSFGSIIGPGLVTLLNSSMDAHSIFLISVSAVFLIALIVLASPSPRKKPRDESYLDTGLSVKVGTANKS